MNIMTKRGSMDNVVTYEHICDTNADLANIDPSQITLGSVAIILQGTNGLEVYIANSNKQWINLLEISGGGASASEIDQLVAELKEVLPMVVDTTWYRKGAQNDDQEGWIINDRTDRCLSDELTITVGDTYSTINDLEFRILWLRDGEIAGNSSTWLTNYTITAEDVAKDYDTMMLHVRMHNGADITPDLVAKSMLHTGSNGKVVPPPSREEVKEYIDARIPAPPSEEGIYQLMMEVQANGEYEAYWSPPVSEGGK